MSEDGSMYILLYILNFEPFKIFKTIKLKNNYLKRKVSKNIDPLVNVIANSSSEKNYLEMFLKGYNIWDLDVLVKSVKLLVLTVQSVTP